MNILHKIQYWWHLGDSSAGGLPCGFGCAVCFRNAGKEPLNASPHSYALALQDLDKEIPSE